MKQPEWEPLMKINLQHSDSVSNLSNGDKVKVKFEIKAD